MVSSGEGKDVGLSEVVMFAVLQAGVVDTGAVVGWCWWRRWCLCQCPCAGGAVQLVQVGQVRQARQVVHVVQVVPGCRL